MNRFRESQALPSRSPVKTAAISPNDCELVCSIASSSDPIDTIGAIGPNVSSVAAIESGGHLGRARWPANKGASGNPRRAPPPVTTSAPRSTASATCTSIFAAHGLVVERPQAGLLFERIAQPDVALDLRGESCDELLAHRLVHEQPLGRGAALTGAEEAADLRGLDRGVEIGVVHHHERPSPPISRSCALPGGLARDRQPSSGRADEPDGVRSRVDRQLVTHLGARPEHEVERRRAGCRPRRRTRRERPSTPRSRAPGVQTTVQPQARAGANTSAGIV